MGAYRPYTLRVNDIARAADGRPSEFAGSGPNIKTITNDVTIINWTGTDSTFTPTRVDTATANAATGTVTFNATDATAAASMQVAIRALGGIYADATVVAGVTADNMIITVFGGYDITWSKTGGAGVITESGAAGSDTATPGGTVFTGYLPVKGLAVAKRIRIAGFADNSLDIAITDLSTPAALTVFSTTAIDTWTSPNDVPYDRLLTADGVAGEDGAAAANVSGGTFQGPFKVVITASGPIVASKGAYVKLVVKDQSSTPAKKLLKRGSGALTVLPGSFNLGDEYVNVKQIFLQASSDTSVAPTLTDADGLVIYTKTSTDYTTNGVRAQLSHEGVDQANNAVADLLDVIARSPVTLSGSGLGAGTFKVECVVEA